MKTSRQQLAILLSATILVLGSLACKLTSPPSAPLTGRAASLPDSAALAQAITGQITVGQVTGFANEYNYWYVHGLVRNDTNQAVTNIRIEVRLTDTSGSVLYSEATYSSIAALAPGEVSPFSFYSAERLSGVASLDATVTSFNATRLERAAVDISGVTIWYDETYNDIYLAGNLTNPTDRPVTVKGLAGTLADASGALVTADTAYPLVGYLHPGLSAPFAIRFEAPPGQGASLTDYQFYLDARFTDPASYPNVTVIPQHFDTLDTLQDFHLVSSFTNNSPDTVTGRLIAGLYDEAGNCIDVAALYLPIAIPPGGTIPYDFDSWNTLNTIPEAYEAASYYEIFIDWSATREAYTYPVQIATRADANTFDGYRVTYTGEVVNSSAQELESATVIISMLDITSRQVIATDFSYVTGPIPIAGALPYAVYLYPPRDFDPTSVEVTITAYGQ